MAHELSKVRFNSTNEAMAWGKYRRWVLDGNVNDEAKNLAIAELSNVERAYGMKRAQSAILDVAVQALNCGDNEKDLMMTLWVELAVDAQFYHEAIMYAKGERV